MDKQINRQICEEAGDKSEETWFWKHKGAVSGGAD